MIARSICFYLLLILPFQFAAAEDKGIVTIEGVRFFCDGCIILDEDYCGIPQAGQSLVMPCSEVFDHLLRVNVALELQVPTSRELLQYILRESPSSIRLQEILSLVAARDDYGVFSSHELLSLLRRYPKEVQEAILKGWGDVRLLSRVWSLLRGNHETSLTGIKALVAARSDEAEISEVVRELSSGEYEKDVAFLRATLEFAKQFDSTLARELEVLSAAIENCFLLEVTSLAGCKLESNQPEVQVARRYLSELLVTQVRRLLASEVHSIAEKSKLLSVLQLELLSESQIQSVALVALPVFLEHADQLDRELLEESRLVDLLALSGISQQHLLEQVAGLVRRVQQQEKVSPSSNAKVTNTPLMVAPLTLQSSVATKEAQENRRRLSLYIFLAFGITAGLVSMYLYRKLPTTHAYSAEKYAGELLLDDLRVKQEVIELLTFFKLPADAGVDEVRKAYRQMVRMYHPDISNQSSDKFLELQAQYEKAQRLLGD